MKRLASSTTLAALNLILSLVSTVAVACPDGFRPSGGFNQCVSTGLPIRAIDACEIRVTYYFNMPSYNYGAANVYTLRVSHADCESLKPIYYVPLSNEQQISQYLVSPPSYFASQQPSRVSTAAAALVAKVLSGHQARFPSSSQTYGFQVETLHNPNANASASVQPLPAPQAPNPTLANYSLNSNFQLVTNQSASYGDGSILVMQGDCNLVIYRAGLPIWASGTNGRGSNCVTYFQGDGNLVIYSGSTAVFASNTDRTGTTLNISSTMPHVTVTNSDGTTRSVGYDLR